MRDWLTPKHIPGFAVEGLRRTVCCCVLNSVTGERIIVEHYSRSGSGQERMWVFQRALTLGIREEDLK